MKSHFSIFLLTFFICLSCETVIEPISMYKPYLVYDIWDYSRQFDIYSVNESGSFRKRLSNSPFRDIQPSVSPDGKKIVFTSNRNTYFEIFIMDVNGLNVQQLTKENWSGWPIFSPDGLHILYLHEDFNNNQRDLYLMNRDGSNKRNLTNSDITPHNHSFSPDGQQIVFEGREKYPNDTISHIFKMIRDGSGMTRLTENNLARNNYPKYSHDGKKIVYVSFGKGIWNLKIMNTDSSNSNVIFSDSVVIYDPMFTPNDKHIIYTSIFDFLSYSHDDLFILDLNGENCRRLINGMQGHYNHEANFSKDGKKLAFVSGTDIFIAEINGENPINLTHSQEWESGPRFID